MPSFSFSLSAVCVLVLSLSGCAIGPRYETPTATNPGAFKEAAAAAGWLPAAPADALDRGEWWKLFNDANLDELAARVQVSNQNIAAAVGNYAKAQALVREQRAALFPQVSVDGSGRRSGALRSSSSVARLSKRSSFCRRARILRGFSPLRSAASGHPGELRGGDGSHGSVARSDVPLPARRRPRSR